MTAALCMAVYSRAGMHGISKPRTRATAALQSMLPILLLPLLLPLLLHLLP